MLGNATVFCISRAEIAAYTRFYTGQNGDAITDYGPMAARLLSTVIVTGGLIYTLKDKKP